MNTVITTYGFKASPIEIEIKDLSFVKEFSNLLKKPHKATFYQIVWITTGQAIFKIDFRDITIQTNEVLIISAGQVCEFDTKSDFSGKLILFTDIFFTITELDSNFLYTSEILNPVNLNHPIAICPQLASNLITLLSEELKHSIDKFQSIIAQNYLRIILLEAERQLVSTYSPSISTIGRRFYRAVEQHFKVTRNVDFYINLLNSSEKNLSKEVKALTGKTPKIYIDTRIILEAKRLLSYSNLSIKEIGYELGFEEPTNFNKYFRKHTNVTPVQFRNSIVLY